MQTGVLGREEGARLFRVHRELTHAHKSSGRGYVMQVQLLEVCQNGSKYGGGGTFRAPPLRRSGATTDFVTFFLIVR
jgi:hypothetical protein